MMHIRFRNSVMTLEEYLSFSKKILIGLGEYHNVFHNLFSWAGSEEHWSIGFKGDYSNFEESIFFQGIGDDEIAYDNPDSKNLDLTLQSKSFVNFSNAYSNVNSDSNSQFFIRISAGSSRRRAMGMMNIEFPGNDTEFFYAYNFVEGLMRRIIELVDPIHITVNSDDFLLKVMGEGNDFWIGWMTYLARLDIEPYLDNVYEKKTLKNGTWFALSNEVPCIDDKILMDKAIAIRDNLERFGLLHYRTYIL